jgi:radical SAM superfamily enzyme YgiQ (UPF0313 family)
MKSILLIYPFFRPRHDRSIFRFPPLGLAYIASSLRQCGYHPQLLDCTFLGKESARRRAIEVGADIVGIYSMVTMREDSLWLARALRGRSGLLIAGGPLPSCDPALFLEDFDVVVLGEGENSTPKILRAYAEGLDFGSIEGVAYRRDGRVILNSRHSLHTNLDEIALPARDLFPNEMYIGHWKKKRWPATTTVMTTRGCPFSCEFCSNPIFGVSYRERSPKNVVDEVEDALSLGYERIHFADDVFTLNRERLRRICEEISGRSLHFRWECLGRVDSIDPDTARMMKEAGCDRIFFGIESANDSILEMMNKKITAEGARRAVEVARSAGLRVGSFFILCYPGETDETVLQTIRFAVSLPLDYLSFTMPYPLPGTALYERIKGRMRKEWKAPDSLFSDHSLIFDSDFSESKMKFAISKGRIQFYLQRMVGKRDSLLVKSFQFLTDWAFRLMN